MAFATYSVTELSEIPAAVEAFAGQIGFLTGTLDGDIFIQHPTYAGAKRFTFRAGAQGSGSGYQEHGFVTLRDDTGAPLRDLPGAVFASPKFNVTGEANVAALQVQKPTALRLFGNCDTTAPDAGNSWIAGVVEYGFNLYRHFYAGYIDKLTSFGGGEVVTGSSCWNADNSTSSSRRFDDASVSLLPFSMKNNWVEGLGGGVFIDHPGNAVPYRTFYSSSSISEFDPAFSGFGERCVLGGYMDSINTGYVNVAKSPFSGEQILVPINLYIGQRVADNQYFQAIGAPHGVRMVHIEDLEPGVTVPVGSAQWQIFPVFSKSSSASMPRNGPNSSGYRFPNSNSSLYLGMAYRMDD